MKINTLFIVVFLFVYYLIIPLALIFFIKNAKAKKICNILYLIIFCLILLVGVFFKIDITKTSTQISLDFSAGFFNKSFNFKFWNFDLQDFLINISMLFPLGYCFNLILKTKYKCLFAFLFGLCVGTFIEVCQFIFPFPRSPQLSDIIFNGLSVFIGSLFFFLIDKIKLSFKKNNNIKNYKV